MSSSGTPAGVRTFSEKEFYLSEFRGRTIAIAVAEVDAEGIRALESVLAELSANGTRCVLLSPDRALLGTLAGDSVLDIRDASWVGHVWRLLSRSARVGIAASARESFAAESRVVALRLQFAKLVWIDEGGRLAGPTGETMSLVDLSALDGLLNDGAGLGRRKTLLSEIRTTIAGGVPSVNLCSASGLADELFTYVGSGTLFTRERYIRVRALAIDEFDTAYDLLERGVAEGYLAKRDPHELERLLSHAFGVFVEARYLAGIGALLPYAEERAGEIAGLYTVTRFLREGIGGRLVRFARDQAEDMELECLFACTTSERVEQFFQRLGFVRVEPDALPASKWEAYDSARRSSVRCLRLSLGS